MSYDGYDEYNTYDDDEYEEYITNTDVEYNPYYKWKQMQLNCGQKFIPGNVKQLNKWKKWFICN